jgi:hypothetical protein
MHNPFSTVPAPGWPIAAFADAMVLRISAKNPLDKRKTQI